MKQSESITKLASSLVTFNSKVDKIAKDAQNPFHKSNYATLDQIIDAVRPVLSEHKLSVMQNVSGENGVVHVKTLLLHESGEWLESDGTTLRLAKDDPQGAGAGITYARRYDLCAFLSLNTGEDDDGNSTSRTGNNSNRNNKNQNQNNQQSNGKATQNQIKAINAKASEFVKLRGEGTADDVKSKLKENNGIDQLVDATQNQASNMIKQLDGWINKVKGAST